MAAKTATLSLEGGDLRFVAHSGSGHQLILDDSRGDSAMRPSELIPIAVAGCTAMDVISILRKKRQAVSSYRVRASGVQQDEHPNAFTRIDIVHVVEGEAIDLDAVRRAIELSATKYCAVGATLATGMTEIHHAFAARDDQGQEQITEVVVTGPDEAVDAPAKRGSGAEGLAVPV